MSRALRSLTCLAASACLLASCQNLQQSVRQVGERIPQLPTLTGLPKHDRVAAPRNAQANQAEFSPAPVEPAASTNLAEPKPTNLFSRLMKGPSRTQRPPTPAVETPEVSIETQPRQENLFSRLLKGKPRQAPTPDPSPANVEPTEQQIAAQETVTPTPEPVPSPPAPIETPVETPVEAKVMPPRPPAIAEYIGLRKWEAIARARAEERPWRIAREDSNTFPVAAEKRANRINLTIERGKVIDANGG